MYYRLWKAENVYPTFPSLQCFYRYSTSSFQTVHEYSYSWYTYEHSAIVKRTVLTIVSVAGEDISCLSQSPERQGKNPPPHFVSFSFFTPFFFSLHFMCCSLGTWQITHSEDRKENFKNTKYLFQKNVIETSWARERLSQHPELLQ